MPCASKVIPNLRKNSKCHSQNNKKEVLPKGKLFFIVWPKKSFYTRKYFYQTSLEIQGAKL